jgi:hypothetical protein
MNRQTHAEWLMLESDCATGNTQRGMRQAAGYIDYQSKVIEGQTAEIDRLRAEERLLQTVVIALGGMVEGRPTQRINVLQRVRQLRAIEADPRVVRLLPEEDRDRIMREGADLAADLYYNAIARESAEAAEAAKEAT